MAKSNEKNKVNSPNFLNEKGEIDFAKLLEANPDLLSSFTHQREDDEGGEGGAAGQGAQMAFATGLAALRSALGLSNSYAPLNQAEQIRAMSMSAQVNLGLEASQGLSMDMGGKSTFSAAHESHDHESKKKVKKSIKKS